MKIPPQQGQVDNMFPQDFFLCFWTLLLCLLREWPSQTPWLVYWILEKEKWHLGIKDNSINYYAATELSLLALSSHNLNYHRQSHGEKEKLKKVVKKGKGKRELRVKKGKENKPRLNHAPHLESCHHQASISNTHTKIYTHCTFGPLCFEDHSFVVSCACNANNLGTHNKKKNNIHTYTQRVNIG